MNIKSPIIIAGATFIGGFVSAGAAYTAERLLADDYEVAQSLDEVVEKLRDESPNYDSCELLTGARVSGSYEVANFIVFSCLDSDGSVEISTKAFTEPTGERPNPIFPVGGLLMGAAIGAYGTASILEDKKSRRLE
jgi:hypothetical protein